MPIPNPFDLILQILGLIFLALGAAFSGGTDGQAGNAPAPQTPTPVPAAALPADAVPHVIASVEVFILESMPPQITLGVIGYQPDGCDLPVQISQTRTGNTVTVNIYRELPPGVICTMIAIDYQANIPLEGTFDPGNTYTFIVNGVSVTATL
jgi:hypothetical protein